MLQPLDSRQYSIPEASDCQWTYEGSFLSACESEKYPFDADVVAAIRRDHDPHFIPLLRRTVFRSPSGADYVWEHHVWARAIGVLEAPMGAHHAQRVLWPTNPGAVNYGFEKYADRLYIQKDLGFLGDSTRSPGRTYPMHWGLYKLVGGLMGLARQASQRELARREFELSEAKEAKDRSDANDMYEQTLVENARRLRGDPMVSVPRTFGEAA